MNATVILLCSVVSLLISIAALAFDVIVWSRPEHKGYWTARDLRREQRRTLRAARRNARHYN